MINPTRVLGFLDLAGSWDPTLALVMAGALVVATPMFRWVLRLTAPLAAPSFHLPTQTRIDAPLIAGAAVFGVGWGLAGLCPGPAIAGLVTGSPKIMLFLVTMIAGQWAAARVISHR
jgi:uncharacterized membrane protein YedE/YeeE